MQPEVNVNFFPKTETIVFLVVALVITVTEILLGLRIWHMIVTIVFAYFLIMGGASTVHLEEDILTISSLNPFLRTDAIELKSITRIKPVDRIDRQKESDFGSYFLIYSRRCIIEYMDETQQKSKVYFSILNKKEEKRVLKGLRKLTKREKPQKLEDPDEDIDDVEEDDEEGQFAS